jgi:hypothetical protein
MPGSSTTPGRSDLAMVRPKRVAFRTRNGVGTRGLAFAAQWLAYALPYRRFVAVLADANARLGADVDRYSFIVVDLHHLLLAGLPAHFESSHPSHAVGLSQVRSPAIVMHRVTLDYGHQEATGDLRAPKAGHVHYIAPLGFIQFGRRPAARCSALLARRS